MPSTTRRQVLAAVGAGAAGLAGCLSPSTPSNDLGAVDGDWRMVGRDGGHTRRVDAGPAEPGLAWETALDGGRAAGTPSLADGRLYVPVDAVSEAARHRYRLHALGATAGDERWQVPLRSDPNPSPAVVGDYVVVTARRGTETGRVVAFERRGGAEEWLYDVDARLTAPPTVHRGTVYVPDWRGRVHALSAFDGSVHWSRQVGGDGSSRTFAEPVAVRDGTLYLGSLSGETGVVALDAGTGAERWSRSTDVVTGGPVVDGDLVVVRSHGLVVAFDADGTRRWSFNAIESDGRPMAVDEHRVYVPARGDLYAVDRSGEKAWTYESPDGPAGTPTVVGDDVFVRGEDRLVALSRTNGEERWTASPAGTGTAVVVPGGVFLTGGGGRVIALGDG